MTDPHADRSPSGVALPRYAAPPGLDRRIAAALAEERRALVPIRVWQGRRLALAAALLVTCGMAGAAGYWRGAASGSDEDPLVASHVRSLIGEHLVDVASGDGHTVKPWLDARHDYAPPVVDLAADSIPLVGGRVDYLAGRRVAVLVYRRRAHMVNVYVAPAGSWPASLGRGADARGYHVARRPLGAMELLAISDLNRDELERIAVLLAERAGPP